MYVFSVSVQDRMILTSKNTPFVLGSTICYYCTILISIAFLKLFALIMLKIQSAINTEYYPAIHVTLYDNQPTLIPTAFCRSHSSKILTLFRTMAL